MDDKTARFIELFNKAKATYEDSETRLAAEGWEEPWQVLIATIMSAQNRDPLTIQVSEELFTKYSSIQELAEAPYEDILEVLSSVNYNRNKSKYIKQTAQMLAKDDGNVPDTMKELLKYPGVGRKTANLLLSEVFEKPAICVDTHVHRLSNVFDLVDTDKPDQTERELKKVAPKKYWRHINRYFVLWGQDVAGHDKEKLLDALVDHPVQEHDL